MASITAACSRPGSGRTGTYILFLPIVKGFGNPADWLVGGGQRARIDDTRNEGYPAGTRGRRFRAPPRDRRALRRGRSEATRSDAEGDRRRRREGARRRRSHVEGRRGEFRSGRGGRSGAPPGKAGTRRHSRRRGGALRRAREGDRRSRDGTVQALRRASTLTRILIADDGAVSPALLASFPGPVAAAAL